jgi:hypothetical protein
MNFVGFSRFSPGVTGNILGVTRCIMVQFCSRLENGYFLNFRKIILWQ